MEQLGERMSELRTATIIGSAAGGGGQREQLATLQAAQQSTHGQILSLQTHLRSLLRRAEIEKAAEPTVDAELIESLREEVNEALAELQGQVTALSERKADADRVELALETKAERHLVTNKADRSFCEGLLSRFAVEVGRQLAEMEQGQSSIRENLDDALMKLMASSAERARHEHQPPPLLGGPPAAGGGRMAAGGGSGGGYGGGPTSFGGGSLPMRGTLDMGSEHQQRPFTVHTLRVAERPRSAGPPRRMGGGRHGRSDEHFVPAGKGLLPTSVFSTGDGDPPPPDPRGKSFQPRRPAGMMTPGEQQLVRQRPSTAAGRLSGHALAGRLGHSVSVGMIAHRPPPTPGTPA
jgi:hypothetical protein